MPDTNVIGDIQEGTIDFESVKECDAEFFMTHIQEDEIQVTPDEELQKNLLEIFTTVRTDTDPTESAVIGISKVGRAKLGGGGTYQQLVDELPDDDGNEMNDALIAETAIANEYTLITADQDLQDVLDEHYPDSHLSRRGFIQWLESSTE